MHVDWQRRRDPSAPLLRRLSRWSESASLPAANVCVCLLGARELPKALRKASVEVATGQWVEEHPDNEYVNRTKDIRDDQAKRSKRMYVVGDEKESRDPSFDPEESRKKLQVLERNKNKRKLRQRAAIAGVRESDVHNTRDLIARIMKQYSNIEFRDVHKLVIRLWEKPSISLGALLRAS